MAQFATNAEFATRLGITLTAEEQSRVDGLLELASGMIQDEAGQRIEKVENDVLTRRGAESDRLRLPERPVLAVTRVELAGEELDEGEGWYLDGDELVRLPLPSSQAAFYPLLGGGWGHPDQELVITYTHGYDPIPGAVKAVCLEMVVRVWVNPGSVQQEGYGSEQTTYPVTGGLVLTPSEREVIRDLFRRTAGTVQLR